MIGIPISIFYFIYLAFVGVFLLFTLFNVYHLVRFGFLSIANISIIVFYIGMSIMMLLVSWYYIGQIDWQQVIPIVPQFESLT